ncbi:MAG: hypothetical protein HRT50_11000 [Colwellia sp.]|uniref:hypothetical protein n=1 Tax=Colwellia sp. TaxID=56799 RepID=UPI001E12685E|nr:hypothetical protein [Colwellia sp.]NQY49611.1 hypothetical protein [Colwellia sp.]
MQPFFPWWKMTGNKEITMQNNFISGITQCLFSRSFLRTKSRYALINLIATNSVANTVDNLKA